MKAKRFRVENFRNIEDSGWIPIEDVTAFVGRNEAGKTALLKALHLFNPATSELFEPKRDYPRDRYARDWPSPDVAKDIPVCRVEFIIDDDLKSTISPLLLDNEVTPTTVIATRHYDQSLRWQYDPELRDDVITMDPVIKAFKSLSASVRRYRQPQSSLQEWVDDYRIDLSSKISSPDDVAFIDDIRLLRDQVANYSGPVTARAIKRFQSALDTLIDRSESLEKISDILKTEMPVFIYFENYGVLDSAVWLPRFVDDLKRIPHDPRVRTLNAMFRHANLDPHLIEALDDTQMDVDDLDDDHQDKKEERAIRLNSASIEISKKFSDWWQQRRHKIRYHADGEYFRIYVADDRRQDVDIELENRSKGFQWFFSFYLVFLVESEDQHKNAILLLDEPGLHLHPTAQQKLINFFDELAKSNQLIYTTHSPFLIDGDNLHRIRPVVEKDNGNAIVSVKTWPVDRDTMFPVEAAAGYAIMRGLFAHQKNLLVEGITDFHYLHALSQECAKVGGPVLPDDVVITPCDGTKHIGHMASLFLGHKARPVILLDDDDAGRRRGQVLREHLLANSMKDILLLGDILEIENQDIEMEDLIGKEIISISLRDALNVNIDIKDDDFENSSSLRKRSLPRAIKIAAERGDIRLPEGWKASIASHVASSLAKGDMTLDDVARERAHRLLSALRRRFEEHS